MNYFLLRKSITLFLLLMLFFVSHELFAQKGIIGSDFANGWSNPSNIVYTSNSLGSSQIAIRNTSGTGDKYFRMIDNNGSDRAPGNNCGSDLSYTPGTQITSMCTSTNGAWKVNVPSSSYRYVFKTASTTSSDFIVFEIQGTERSVAASGDVTRSPSGNIYSNQDVIVSAVATGVLSSGQKVYVRYTNNGWTSSSVAAMTLSSGTTYTATIPAATNTANATISYYVFTSGDGSSRSPAPATNGSNADFYTFNNQTNGGANYSYTVQNAFLSASAGDWNTGSTWASGSLPPSGATIVINHAVTINGSVTNASALVTVSSGNSLTFGTAGSMSLTNLVNNGSVNMSAGGTLTVVTNGTLSNNTTTFTAGTGTVVFAGVGTIDGSNYITFNNLTKQTANTGLTLTTVPTVNGTLQINGGHFNQAPNYGSSSILKYNSGGTYGRYNEWNATSGAGYPANVLITNNTAINLGTNGSGTARALSGNLTIDAGAALYMDIDDMTQSLTVNGDILLNGNLSLSDVIGGDLVVKGNWTYNTSSTFVNKARAVTFSGNTAQTISGSGSTTFGFLTIDNATGITLSQDITASNALNINSGKILNAGSQLLSLGSGAAFTNNGTFNYASSTVLFTADGTINGSTATTFNNLSINSGTIALSTVPTINGTFQINGGSPGASPNYGASSILLYNSGETYGRNQEWNSTSGAGYPANVKISNNTFLDIYNNSNTARQISGNLTIDAGSTLGMSSMSQALSVAGNLNLNGELLLSSSAAGDLNIGGNWNRGEAGIFTHDNRRVTFNGTIQQTISGSGGNTFAFLTLNNASGIKLLDNITLTATTDEILNLYNGSLDLNGKTLNVNGSGGAIHLSGTSAFTVTSGTPGTILFNGTTGTVNKTVTRSSTATLSIGTNITVQLINGGVNFGNNLISTINGTLEFLNTGYVSDHAPQLAAGATLVYNTGGNYSRYIEWNEPKNVIIKGNTTLNLGLLSSTFACVINGNLTIENGSSLYMNSLSANATVNGNLNNYGTVSMNTASAKLIVKGTLFNHSNGSLILSGTSGGDLELQGDFQNDAGLNCNGRAVYFKGAVNQAVSGVNLIVDYLVLDKTAGTVTLNNNVNINQRADFIKGIINYSGSAILGFNNGASTTGVNTNSYVNGPVKKTGTNSFMFPVGNATGDHLFGISELLNATASDEFTVTPVDDQQSFGNDKDELLTMVSTCEYWTLSKSNPLATVKVSLGWNSQSCNISYANMRVAGWDAVASKWKDLAVSSLSGNQSQGMVYSPNNSELLQFTTGYYLDCAAASGDAQQNYVRTQVLLTEVTNPSTIDGLTVEQVSQTTQYFDGWGRPIQTVIKQGSPGKNDLVQLQEYDVFGRESISRLPYVALECNGGFKDMATAIDNQENFYKINADPTIAKVDPVSGLTYAETLFEASMMNTPLEQGAPGDAWALGSGHSVKSNFKLSQDGVDVRKWSLNETTGLFSCFTSYGVPVSYQVGELLVFETTDENGTKIIQFKNKLGQMIMKQIQGQTTGEILQTYYLYDSFGMLRYVIPPAAVSEAIANANEFGYDDALTKKWFFAYKYDGWHRMIEKRTPGAEPVKIFYDQLDRPVLTQDGNQRTSDKYSFVKYDVLGRPVMTGITTISGTPDLSSASTLFETRVAGSSGLQGYSNAAYPASVSETNLLSVNYYDDYDFNNDGTAEYSYVNAGFSTAEEPAPFYRNSGQATGSKVRIFENTADWLSSVLFYDEMGRPIQTLGNNQYNLDVDDLTTNVYDFAGRLLKSKTVHTPGNSLATVTVNKRYLSDHSGRVLAIFQKNNNEVSEVQLCHYNYNGLGQLIEKNLHKETGTTAFLQSVDYRYTIRGWISSINNSSLTNDNGLKNNDANDLFGMEFKYNEGFAALNGAAQFNGNISAIQWKTSTDAITKGYGFSYDYLGQLTSAEYGEKINFGNWTANADRYSLTDLTYDKNGNILTMQQKGLTGIATFGVMDNLSYTYSGNKLIGVNDAATGTAYNDFSDNGHTTAVVEETVSTHEYTYDNNGNLTKDVNKNISSITYNYLNLPTRIEFGSSATRIEFAYTAAGTKLQKKKFENGTLSYTTDYVNGFVYAGGSTPVLEYFPTEEGRAVYNSTANKFRYEYYLKDHLGNIRVSFANMATDGTVNLQILEQNSYYPSGLTFGGLGNTVITENKEKFNGKELQDDFGLNWYDYEARMYDPQISRFTTQDPLADNYADYSPYTYVLNNPVNLIDPTGMAPVYDWEKQKYYDSGVEVGITEVYSWLSEENRAIHFEEDEGAFYIPEGDGERYDLNTITKKENFAVHFSSSPDGIVKSVLPAYATGANKGRGSLYIIASIANDQLGTAVNGVLQVFANGILLGNPMNITFDPETNNRFQLTNSLEYNVPESGGLNPVSISVRLSLFDSNGPVNTSGYIGIHQLGERKSLPINKATEKIGNSGPFGKSWIWIEE